MAQPERPDPLTEAIYGAFHGLGLALRAGASLLWRFRTELAIALAGAAVFSLVAPWAFILLAVVVIGWPRSRGWLNSALTTARGRRQFTEALADSKMAGAATVKKVKSVRVGEQLLVSIQRGTVADLERNAGNLARRLSRPWAKVQEVRVTPVRGDASRARILIVRREAFDEQPMPWPLRDAEEVSLWDPTPLGVDELGDEVAEVFVGKNMLIGGEPGGGKSAAQSLLIAAAAKDPNCDLWIMDGKQLDTAVWAPAARRLVGPVMDDALEVLDELHRVMNARFDELLAAGREKITRDQDLRLHMVVIDELAHYLRHDGSKTATQKVNAFLSRLTDLISLGRATGIIVCMATQRPGSELHPSFTGLRDLVNFRIAFRATNWQMSDIILGTGHASTGFDASDIPIKQRGVGIIVAEGERPQRMKGYYLTHGEDGDLSKISAAAAARHLDSDAEQLLATPEPVAPVPPPTPSSPPSPKPKAVEVRASDNRRALLAALPATGDGLTRSEIGDAVGRPDRELFPVVQALLGEELVTRSGEGVKGDPYRYLLVVRTADAQDVRGRDHGAGRRPGSAPRRGIEHPPAEERDRQ